MKRFAASLKWLHPGMGVKRWVALAFCGLFVFLVGSAALIETQGAGAVPVTVRTARWLVSTFHSGAGALVIGVGLCLLGIGICVFALGMLIHTLVRAVNPAMARGGLVDVVYQRRKLSQGRRIVVIGGGTGLSTMLRGLKRYSSNITAIVTVADDGGSSGKLRKQLNILPPGDIRNCLVALADAEAQMTELFQYRFRNIASAQPAAAGAAAAPPPVKDYGEGLRDHAFGNLLIAAMCAINEGDFERAVRETSRVLNVRGRVLPSTDSAVVLRGEMEDGTFLEGETAIASARKKVKRVSLVPPNACPLPDVLAAIEQADVIILGPGSVFTSIIPNLLLRGLPEAVRASRAKKVYVCNVMTQPGETDGFSAFSHVQAVERHAGCRIFDYVLVNTGQPTAELLAKYRKTGAVLVEPDTDRIRAAGYRAITGNFISQTDVVRHNAASLAEAVVRLLG